MCRLSCLLRSRSICSGLKPAIRELGLQCIVIGRVVLPKIPLTEPDDVILLRPAIPVEGFVLGNEVLVCASSDRSRGTARIDLRARVEQVRQILYADAVAHFETRGRVIGVLRRFQGFLFFHSETSPPQSFPATRLAKCGFYRRASEPRPKSNVRSTACRDRAYNPNRYRPGGAFPLRSIYPSSQVPRMSHK